MVWTYETLVTKGHPVYRVTLADVAKVEEPGEREVTVHVQERDQPPDAVDRRLSLPVLPKHLVAGPGIRPADPGAVARQRGYRMARVDPGRSIVWERIKDYWAENLPVSKGTGNFDTVQTDYYRDNTVLR